MGKPAKKINKGALRSIKLLTDAFFEWLTENPTKPITVTALCDRAGVSYPTFYAHFDKIEDIPGAFFDIWLNEMEGRLKQRVKQIEIAERSSSNINTSETSFLYEYWCSNVDLVIKLKNAGYEEVVIEAFKKAFKIKMKETVVPFIELSPYFQRFLQAKAALVSYELYTYWIDTGMKLSVEQLAEVHCILCTFREIEEISEIMLSE